MPTMIERVEAMMRGEIPKPAANRLIGFDIVSFEPGKAVFAMEAGPQHANPMGTLHGGILCDIADAAMGVAYSTGLQEGESFTTLEPDLEAEKRILAGQRAIFDGMRSV